MSSSNDMLLTRRLDTETLIACLHYRLDLAIEQCIEEGRTMDIAGMRMTLESSQHLMGKIKLGLKVKDSKDATRMERILRSYERINSPQPTKELPIPEVFEDAVKYGLLLDVNEVYIIPKDMSERERDLMLTLVTLVFIKRPRITIDITGQEFLLGTRISHHITSGRRAQSLIDSTDEFMFISPDGLFVQKIEAKDMHKRFPFNGKYSNWPEIFREYRVLPTYFGRESIMKNELYAEVFQEVYHRALDRLSIYFAQRDTESKKLIDFVKES